MYFSKSIWVTVIIYFHYVSIAYRLRLTISRFQWILLVTELELRPPGGPISQCNIFLRPFPTEAVITWAAVKRPRLAIILRSIGLPLVIKSSDNITQPPSTLRTLLLLAVWLWLEPVASKLVIIKIYTDNITKRHPQAKHRLYYGTQGMDKNILIFFANM
jgi:hypothetical protein